MNVTFFENSSQEDEGMEIFSFPDVFLRNEEQSYSEAEYFLMSLDSVSPVSEVIEIITFYNELSMISLIEIIATENVKAIVHDKVIKFKKITSSEFKNEINLDVFLKILLKWNSYLLTANKQQISFDL